MLDNAIKLQSVVAVRSHVPDTAFTANALGTLREGSGGNEEGSECAEHIRIVHGLLGELIP